MNTADQVAKIIELYKMDGAPISDAAWETALACVGWPYVFGAWGEECTPSNRKRRAREDHPTIISKCQVLNGTKDSCTGCQWFPGGNRVRMFDCRGFTDWILKQYGIDLKGEGATSQWNTESNWTAKGTIDTVPDDILVCLFVQKGSKMEHTGFGYKGATCECSSGVQYFEKRKAKWTHWAMPAGIGGDAPQPDPDKKPTLRKGDKGPYVAELQTDLVRLGFDLGTYGPKKNGIDGSFGQKTESAVKAFQMDHDGPDGRALVPDGIVGQKTWWALDQAIDPEPEPQPALYTVTIPHLTEEAATALCRQYTGATMKEE